MEAQEIIDKLEADFLHLLSSGLKATLSVDVSLELYRELEKRAYFRCNHSTICQIWQGLPITVEHHLGQPYRINMERQRVLIENDSLKYMKMEACEDYRIVQELLQRINDQSCQNHVIKKASHLSD